MAGEGAASFVDPDRKEFNAVLAELDSASAANDARWANKRDGPRKRARVPCTVRYLTPDGKNVESTEACVRDLSAAGIGFVVRHHFARGAAVFLILRLPGGKTRKLTATVVYSRVVLEGWFLTGAKFDAVPEAELLENAPPPARAAKPKSSESGKQPKAGGKPVKSAGSGRENALRLLSAAASSGVASKDAVNKIVLCSGSDDHVIRRASIPALMQITSAAGRLGLEGLLRDPNPEIQVEAAEALGCIGAENAIEPLKALLNHKEPEVALRVAAALGRLHDRSGLAAVRRYLGRNNPYTRAAVRALGVIVGRRFRLNDAGIAEARKHLKSLRKL